MLLFHKCIAPNHKQLIKRIHKASKMCILSLLHELSIFSIAKTFYFCPEEGARIPLQLSFWRQPQNAQNLSRMAQWPNTVGCMYGSWSGWVSFPPSAAPDVVIVVPPSAHVLRSLARDDGDLQLYTFSYCVGDLPYGSLGPCWTWLLARLSWGSLLTLKIPCLSMPWVVCWQADRT